MHRSKFEIIGAPFDRGSPKPGCGDAPRVLREKGLVRRLQGLRTAGVTVTDGGDVPAPPPLPDPGKPKHAAELLTFSASLMEKIGDAHKAGNVPVVVGGDHAVSIPSVSATAAFARATGGEDAHIGLLWVDAHPDIEPPESDPNADLHGMSVAHLLGYGDEALRTLGGFQPKLLPEHIAYIAIREVVASERELIRKHDLRTFTPTDIERMGIFAVCKEAFARVSTGTVGFVLSFDMDACNPAEIPGVTYREPGGLTYREAQVVMEYAARSASLMSLELVEYLPARDRDNESAFAAIELLRTALGGTIL
ncbi:MAG: arginase [Planctomycetota bacterium]